MSAISELVIVGGVFLTVVLLCVVIIVSTVGTQATASRQMNKRIQRHLDRQEPGSMSLLRERYLDRLSPVERSVEGSTMVAMLSRQVEQSGVRTSALKIILQCLVFSAICAALAVMWFDILIVTIFAVGIGAAIPIVQLRRQGQQRRLKFEGQLSEALDMMARALRTGQPFHETLNLVSEEMEQPISDEFSRVSSDLNFGLPPKVALEGMLGRVPSTSLQTVVTAVLIQKETGGRLAEVLEKVSVVIRSRQSLKRKLNTLSADGRMSAWVLGLMPLALALLMSLASPGYLDTLIEDPFGQKLVVVACALMLSGVIWIRKIVRVEL